MIKWTREPFLGAVGAAVGFLFDPVSFDSPLAPVGFDSPLAAVGFDSPLAPVGLASPVAGTIAFESTYGLASEQSTQ